jgi:hypothetical protein
MRRIHPLILIAVFLLLLIVGFVGMIRSADDCWDKGGTVLPGRGERCVLDNQPAKPRS